MTEEEKFEAEVQDPEFLNNIAGRIKNHAIKELNSNLTRTGDALCNTIAHMIKSLYSFADTLPEDKKTELKKMLGEMELVPGNHISMVTPRKK